MGDIGLYAKVPQITSHMFTCGLDGQYCWMVDTLSSNLGLETLLPKSDCCFSLDEGEWWREVGGAATTIGRRERRIQVLGEAQWWFQAGGSYEGRYGDASGWRGMCG